ncbi:uncharacterized protein LOC124615904 [Schistocerca americana]|uniref:uncharacterized protein LOC124615904 n=1 Tax=Schistocerca americana TaxID=7009 RepID=UPI001F4FDA9C|nr:uncharacterized protein LOC124615904 [Schistocerca americana]
MDSMKKYWISCIQNGNINSIVKDVKDFLMRDDAGCAAEKLLAELASNISKKHSEYTGNPTDIHTFASVCCQAISCGNVANELSYLRCIYHIVKHLIDQGETASAFSISEFIFLVEKSSISSNEALMNTCYSAYWILRDTLNEAAVSNLSFATMLDRGKLCINILSCCGAKYLQVLVDTALKIDKLSDMFAANNSVKENLDFLIYSLKISVEAVKLTKIKYTCMPFLQKYIQLFLTVLKKDVLQNYLYFSDVLNAMNNFTELTKFENDEKLCISVLCELAAKGQPIPSVSNLALKEFIDLLASKHSCRFGNTVAFTISSIPFVFSKLITAWSNWSAQEWQTIWTSPVQCAFYDLILKLLSVLYELLPSEGENIQKEKSTVDSILNLHRLTVKLVYHMLRQSIDVKLENLDAAIPLVTNILDFCVKWVLCLRDSGHGNWVQSWEQLGPVYYNTAALLLNAGYRLYSKPVFFNFFKMCLRLGSPVEGADLNSGIYSIQCAIEEHDVKGGLRICAVCLVNFPNDRDKIFRLWVKLKCVSSNNMEIQKCNLFHILVDEEEAVCSEFPGANMDNCDINELLVAELQYYEPYSARLWSAIESAGRTLYALDPCRIDSSRGIDVYLKCAWQQADAEKTKKALAVGKERIAMLTRAEKEKSDQEKVKILGFLGDTCFTVYILELKSLQKNQQEIISAQKCSTEEGSRDTQGEATDVANTVFTEHLSVSIEKEMELIELLNKALHAWTQLLDHVHFITCDMQPFFKHILDSIEAASYFYGLNGCTIHKVYCWLVYYKVAVSLEMKNAELHAISNLLKTDSFMPPELWLLESKILTFMDSNGNCDSCQLYYYRLCKSFHHLKHGHYDEGFQLLLEIKDQLIDSSTFEKELLQLEWKFFFSVYLSIPEWKIPTSYAQVDCISNGVAAFKKIIELIKHKRTDLKIHARLLCMLMDVAYWLVDIHLCLYWTLDVYQILRELLVITQIAGLSTRSAYILTVMAEIDIMRGSFANANVKLSALHSFYISELWLQHSCNTQPVKDSPTYMHKLCEEMTNMSITTSDNVQKIIDFQLDTQTRREIVLATSVTRTSGKELSSPVCQHHHEKRLSMHPPSSYCQCYSCNNLLSHGVLLHYIMVMALFNHFSGNSKTTLEFFEDGLSVCNALYKIQKHGVQEMNQIMLYILQGMEKNSTLPSSLVEKIKTFVHCYAKFLSQNKKHEEAKALYQAMACFEQRANDKSYCMPTFLEHQFALKLLSLGDNPLLDTSVYKSRVVDVITDMSSTKTPDRAPAVTQLTPVMRYTSKEVDSEFRSNMHRLRSGQHKILFDMDEEADSQCSVNVREEKWQKKVQEYSDILNIKKSEVVVTKCGGSQNVLSDVDRNASSAIIDDTVTPCRRQKVKSRQLSSQSSDEMDNYVSQLICLSPLKENFNKNICDDRDHKSNIPSNLSNQKLRHVKSSKVSKVRNIESVTTASKSDALELITSTTTKSTVFKSPQYVPHKQKPKSTSKTLLGVGEHSVLAPRRTRQRKFSSHSSDENESQIPKFLLNSPLKDSGNAEHGVKNIKKVAKRTTACHKSTGIKIFSECSDINSDCTEGKVMQNKCKSKRKAQL